MNFDSFMAKYKTHFGEFPVSGADKQAKDMLQEWKDFAWKIPDNKAQALFDGVSKANGKSIKNPRLSIFKNTLSELRQGNDDFMPWKDSDCAACAEGWISFKVEGVNKACPCACSAGDRVLQGLDENLRPSDEYRQHVMKLRISYLQSKPKTKKDEMFFAKLKVLDNGEFMIGFPPVKDTVPVYEPRNGFLGGVEKMINLHNKAVCNRYHQAKKQQPDTTYTELA